MNEIVLNLFEAWFELIKFSANFASSTVLFDQIKRQWIKCFGFFLKSSNQHLKQRLSSSSSSDEMFLNLMLRLVDNYVGFLIRSGYVEKAIGLYQALLDFNLCDGQRTQYKTANVESRLTLFELFWDIGLPKFGEAHSDGWLNCLDNREAVFQKVENSNGN